MKCIPKRWRHTLYIWGSIRTVHVLLVSVVEELAIFTHIIQGYLAQNKIRLQQNRMHISSDVLLFLCVLRFTLDISW